MKKWLSLILAALMVFTVAGCSSSSSSSQAPASSSSTASAPASSAASEEVSSDETRTIGWSMMDLSNVLLATVTDKVEALCEEEGIDIIIGDAKGTVTTQIEQVENMIAANVDVIMCLAIDPDAMTSTFETATEAGIGVFSWDSPQDCAKVNYLIDNETLGYKVAEYAVNWAKGVYGDDAAVQVAVMQGGNEIVHIQRTEGIVKGLQELAPNFEIVAQVEGSTVTDCMTAAENFMQANPDIKVICCIGDTLAVAANEVLKASGADPAQVGIFSVDATDEASTAIKNGEFVKMSFGIGTPTFIANEVFNYLKEIMDGVYDDQPKDVMRAVEPIDASNVEEWMNS